MNECKASLHWEKNVWKQAQREVKVRWSLQLIEAIYLEHTRSKKSQEAGEIL